MCESVVVLEEGWAVFEAKGKYVSRLEEAPGFTVWCGWVGWGCGVEVLVFCL